METETIVNSIKSICNQKEHQCHYDGCYNHVIHILYKYCKQHMAYQTPLHQIDKPDMCQICFDSDDNYITLTCGHQLHKECMIKCGRPICPICKQFVYMTPDVFLRLRVNNLLWKLNNMNIDIDDNVIISFKYMLKEIDVLLVEEPNEMTYRIVDKILSKFNTIVLNWYYSE